MVCLVDVCVLNGEIDAVMDVLTFVSEHFLTSLNMNSVLESPSFVSLRYLEAKSCLSTHLKQKS